MPAFKFNGMNNKLRPNELTDKAFKAVNVQFSNTGEVILPAQTFASVHSGNCHSVNHSGVGTLYVEGGVLYLLADTPDSLLTGVGSNAVSYTRPIGSTVYFSNGTVKGKYVKAASVTREWGTPVPSNPTVAAITTGGMYAGEYRVVITWIADEESGAGTSTQVTVEEGGGIRLTSFPTPPDYVTKIGIYCSSVNGKDLYLYSEVNANTSTLDIAQFNSSIVLDTQFAYPPSPPANSTIIDHYGRIYYTNSELLYYTEPQRYGLQRSYNFFPFDSAIQTVVSVPGALYVGTLNALYRIVNIDGEGGAILEQLQDCASVKGSECYDPDGNAYFMSHRGFIKATPEGLQELSYNDVAIPFYTSGSMTVTEIDGLKYLIFYGSGGTSNPLANADWLADETYPESSGWALNLTTGAVSKYESLSINNLNNGYVSSGTGIAQFGADQGGSGYVTTGKTDFGSSKQKRVSDAFLGIDGGKCTLTVIADNATVAYETRATTKLETVKTNLAKGAKGRYWQFKIANKTNTTAIVSELEPVVVETPRH